MRAYTKAGFLKQYIQALSYSNTSSIRKLAGEFDVNPRLVFPCAYYLLTAGRTPQNGILRTETSEILSGNREDEVRKIERTFRNKVGELDRIRNVKKLMCRKTKELMKEKQISAYRISKDLGLDASNLNKYLKDENTESLSYEKAENVLEYLSA